MTTDVIGYKQFRAQWIKKHGNRLDAKAFNKDWTAYRDRTGQKPSKKGAKKAPKKAVRRVPVEKAPEPAPAPVNPAESPEIPAGEALQVAEQPSEIIAATAPPVTAPVQEAQAAAQSPENVLPGVDDTAASVVEGYHLMAKGAVYAIDAGVGAYLDGEVRMTEEEKSVIPEALAAVIRKHDTEGTMLQNSGEVSLLLYSIPYLVRAVPAVMRKLKKTPEVKPVDSGPVQAEMPRSPEQVYEPVVPR